MAVFAAGLIIGSAMLALHDEHSAQAATAPPHVNVLEYPTSIYDISVHTTGDDVYSYYFATSNFTGLFKDSAGQNGAVSIVDENENTISFSPLTVYGLNSVGKPVENVSAVRNGSRVTFESAFGNGFDLRYDATYNGVKESLVIDARPRTSSDIVLWSRLDFDRTTFHLEADGEPIEGNATIHGPITVASQGGTAVFSLPRPFVLATPPTHFDAERGREARGGTEHIAYLDYEVQVHDDGILVGIALPAAIHQDSNWSYPLVIDPPIISEVSNPYYVTNDHFTQPYSVSVMGSGTLIITNSQIDWGGAYSLTVMPGGMLYVNDSELRGLSPSNHWSLEILGSASIERSTIRDMADGVVVDTTANFNLVDSVVSYSQDSGLKVINEPSALTVTGSQFLHNAYAGVEISGTDVDESATLVDFSIADNAVGLRIEGADVGAEISDLVFGVNGDFGIDCDDSTVTVNDFEITGSATGANFYMCTATLRDASIKSNEEFDVEMESSQVIAVEGNYYEWVRDSTGSTLEVRKRIDVTVVDEDGSPMDALNVDVVDADTVTEWDDLTTNQLGMLNDLELRMFEVNSEGDFTFNSPHTFELGTSPQRDVHVMAGSSSRVVLHYTGDADNDGRVDSEEDTPADAWWYEAEAMAKSSIGVREDSHASGRAVSTQIDGYYFRELGWPELGAGTYQFGFQASSLSEGATLNLTAEDSTGSPVLSVVSYWMTGRSNWYWSPEFTLASTQTVLFQLNEGAPTSPGTISLDRVAILRIRDSGGSRTTAIPGQVTDHLTADSDSDFGNDSTEVREGSFPMEAESLGVTGGNIALAAALGGRVVNHGSDVQTIFAADLSDLPFETSENYEYWIRARKTVSNASQLTVTLRVGGANFSQAITLSTEFEWYDGPQALYATAASTVIITARDSSDPSLGDGTDWVQVDSVILAKKSLYSNASRFYLSSPLSPDADMDALPDGSEINGYFISDLHRADNYTLLEGATVEDEGILFDDISQLAFYEFEARYQGIYKLYIPARFGATEGGSPTPQYGTMSHLFEMALNTSVGNPVPRYAGEFAVFDYSQSAYYEDVYRQFGTSFAYFFDLSVGTYNLTVFVNYTAAAALAGLGIAFRGWFDQIYIEKYQLNTLDRDYEDDNITDGMEIQYSMFPLWRDSDYDVLSDWEEFYEGNDGFTTNPVREDTDGDGLRDGFEEGYDGDSDPESTTNPTKIDTDGDGIPDGWIDGWFADLRKYDWDKPSGFPDGLPQPWEGEDLNLDGDVNGGAFEYDEETYETIGGETDPDDGDSDDDGMDDGWELFFWGADGPDLFVLNPLYDDAEDDLDVLDVIGLGANGDGTGDNLSNIQEYALRSNPFSADFDHDFLEDGAETRVTIRTSVPDGAFASENYLDAELDDWIYWDPNPYDGGPGAFYVVSVIQTDAYADAPFNANGTQRVAILRDGALITYNASEGELYVWMHISDKDDADQNGVLEGTVVVFAWTLSTLGPTSNSPHPDHLRQELPGALAWNDPDSDNDGLIDGYEGWPLGGGSPFNDWNEDVDGDGVANVLDADSDNDGLPDGLEWSNGDADFDPSEGETHAFAADTDDDGVFDGNDTLPLDFDNDYLWGYGEQVTANGTIAALAGLEGEWETDPEDPDTDGDGLFDGLEDANLNGTQDEGETSPLDRDSDDDGLWDGPFIASGGSPIVLDPGVSAHNDDNVDDLEDGGTGQDYSSFLERPWFVPRDQLNFTGVSLSARAYLVYANLSAWTSHNNTTFDIGLLLAGKYQFETTVTLNQTGLNWINVRLGALVAPSAASYTVSFYSKAAHFYLRNATLVPGDLGEREFGTDALANDTDGDGLQDGTEVSIDGATATTDAEVSGGPYAIIATDLDNFEPDEDEWRSNPIDHDTDDDGLWDGFHEEEYGGELTDLGEFAEGSNPSNNDTDGDSWTDFYEIIEVWTHATSADSDNDGLPDPYEPIPRLDFDNDTAPNVLDPDSDAAYSVSQNDSDSQETLGGETLHLEVVFRTNATAGAFEAPGVWVAAATCDWCDLFAFTFEKYDSSLPGSATPVVFKTTYGGPSGTSVGATQIVKTFEGWPVYSSLTGQTLRLHILRPDEVVITLLQTLNTAGMVLGRELTWDNSRQTNFVYRETLNWSAVLTQDGDNDGLTSAVEAVFGTNASVPDTDFDGLPDGEEYSEGLNGTNPDTDGDGLTDGVELPFYHTLPGLADSDLDGLWDGNFTWFNGHTENRSVGEHINHTRERMWDSDIDGVADGWEVYYHLNPIANNQSEWDLDHDWMTIQEEFWWNASSNWDPSIHGVSWRGTDPTDLDTDGDTMSDGYEAWWGLDPKNATDKELDPDGDMIQSYREYNWSIVNGSFDTPNEGWYPPFALDPFSNDTDRDLLSDNYEMNRSVRDYDGDLIGNGADEDSDDDGLWDDEEVAGWNVSVIPARILRENKSFFLDSAGNINWSVFPLWWNASNPYANDTDNDTVLDFEEFWNGSNPTTNDTDADWILDADDRTLDENLSTLWTRAIQDMEPPEIEVAGYSFGACTLSQYGDCANLTLRLKDNGSGVFTVQGVHLGSGWTESRNVHALSAKPGGDGAPLCEVTYWLEIPISGVHDRLGTFKVALTVKDRLLNENYTTFVGGDTFNFFRSTAILVAFLAGPILSGNYLGMQYAASSVLVDSVSMQDEILSGRLTLDEIMAGLGQIPHLITHVGEAYDLAYLDYMQTLAFAINPYTPSKYDLENYSDNESLFFLRYAGHEWDNVSDWLKFAIAFWDGLVTGGVVGTAALAVATAGVGAAVVSAIKGLSVVQALLEALGTVVEKVMNLLRKVLDSIKATAAYKRIAIAAGMIWSAGSKGIETLSDAANRLAMSAARFPNAIKERVLDLIKREPSRLGKFLCAAGVTCLVAGGVAVDAQSILMGIIGMAGRYTDDILKAAEEAAARLGKYVLRRGEPFRIAEDGGAHATKLQEFMHLPISEVRKTQQSMLKQMADHLDKIQNPANHPGWFSKTLEEQRGLIGHWTREVRNFYSIYDIATEVLRLRGG